MGWFDEQIRQRKENDNSVFEDSFVNIAGSILGKKVTDALKNESQLTKNAIDEILKYYHVKSQDVPEKMKDVNEQLEFLMRPYGIMRRTVKLEKDWYKDAIGAMLGIRKSDGSVVALIPKRLNQYTFLDNETGKRIRVNKKTAELFEDSALAFYAPFPMRKLHIADLLKYIAKTIPASDYIRMAISTLTVTLVGMLLPKINNLIFSDVINSDQSQLLYAVAFFLIAVTISSALFNSIKATISSRINTRLDVSVQAATMMRILSLPANFFKEYSSGELSSRTRYLNSVCQMLVQSVLETGLTSVFSLIYISQIFIYAPSLVVPALCIILATIISSVIFTFIEMKRNKAEMNFAVKEGGMAFALISGIQKIRLSGAEKRAFARWGNLYAKRAEYEFKPIMTSVVSTLIAVSGTLIMYYASIKSNISVADYYAFNTAYGMVSGAFMSLTGIVLTIAKIKPIFEMVKPILDAEPEISEGRQVVTKLSGGIELNNITFRYNDNMPPVLDDLSLKIRRGQYVAIVGKTGCGKSTLMRLLLGFEKPQKGAVYYDGKDINSIDIKSLRRKIGVVMQNGKLFQGDIYSNIVISAPQLSLNDAWEAAELAGIAEDIRDMPMGMFTIVSEGSGGISGGQRQRLLIARAIAPKPKILMFDEATSALDNITQKIVSDSLANLKCTRIVIAHRLSTIKQCDRIIVLDKGKIIEDGKYDELIAQNGFFTELVQRQRIDSK